MSQNASDIMVDVLHQWGVRVVFGLPGDGINGIIEAFRKREKDIRFIQVRHEEAAAFAATAYAELTGKLGVCVATSGPGGIHLLNGLYDAKLDVVKKALGDEPRITYRPADVIKPELDRYREEIKPWMEQEEDILSYAMFPQVSLDYFKYRQAQKYKVDSTLLDAKNAVHPV